MDVIYIYNGLGNQMSQYAFYLSKSSRSKSVYCLFHKHSVHEHNGFELKNVFNISIHSGFKDFLFYLLCRILISQKYPLIIKPFKTFLGIFKIKYIREASSYDYNPSLLEPSHGISIFNGGWHSEKYFVNIAAKIRETFKFDEDRLNTDSIKILHEMMQVNSVAVHIRRGDYFTEQNYPVFGCVCGKEYYLLAIEEIKRRIINPYFFVFSNDIPWVMENIHFDNVTYVDCNTGENSWMDMFLMSKCQHNINSNSTFSWWGAWLNSNKDKIVIVPRYFINNVITKDIYPGEWLKL